MKCSSLILKYIIRCFQKKKLRKLIDTALNIVSFLIKLEFIQIRIITEYLLKVFKDKIMLQRVMFFGLNLNLSKKIQPEYDILIYFHGFLDLNNNFLIDSAKSSGCVTFRIDYNSVSNQKYPFIMDECFNSYFYLINNTSSLFDFKVGKIILSGDSVGSLICLNLVKHIIKNNLRLPDGLLLFYPC